MARLNDAVRRFIVIELAMFSTPTEVAERVKAEFDLEVTRQQVHEYDPLGSKGGSLAKKWKTLFETTRERFLKEVSRIPIANKSYRLHRLDRMFRKAEARGNLVLAAALLEQAAKEVGGCFTNRREFTGKDGKDLPVASAVVVLPAKEVLGDDQPAA